MKNYILPAPRKKEKLAVDQKRNREAIFLNRVRQRRLCARFVVIGILLFVLLPTGVSFASDASDQTRLRLFVGIEPLAYFVERVIGEVPGIEVNVLIGSGQSPETFDPGPKDIAHLFEADVYFKTGLPFESRLLAKISQMESGFNVVDTRIGIKLRRLEQSGHSHPDHQHSSIDDADSGDPHIWLNPQLAKIQAENICRELIRIDPDNAATFAKNLDRFKSDLEKTDSTIMEILAPHRGEAFYVFHPAYGYFADRYGLRQTAMEVDGKEPGAKDLVATVSRARSDGIGAIFVQPQFSTKSALAIAHEIGAAVVPLDHLAPDYLKNLIRMAEAIDAALGKSSGGDGKTGHELRSH